MKRTTALAILGLFTAFLVSLLFQSCQGQTPMKTYTVTAGSTYATPSITRYAGDTLTFDFILTRDWSQLYNSQDNSTHKICGIRDFMGLNSLRLGVRRAPQQQNGLVAVPYTHNNGTVDYTAFKTAAGKPLLLQFETTYRCTVYKTGGGWQISVFSKEGALLATATKNITIRSLGRIVSGTYIEVGDQPSPWTIRTQIGIL